MLSLSKKTQQPHKRKRISNLKIFVALILSVITSLFFFLRKEGGEIYLIPQGYIGTVVVFFDMPNGKEAKYEKDKRVYEIDSNGILFTKCKEPLSLVPLKNVKYFYYDKKSKKRKELKYIDKDLYDYYNRDSVCVFSKVKENGLSDKTHKQYDYLHFIVGTMKISDSLYLKREKTHLPNLINE